MGWRDQLAPETPDRLVMPWLGGWVVYWDYRAYKIGRKPREHGWYRWDIQGRFAAFETDLVEAPAELPKAWAVTTGYLIGNKLVTGSGDTQVVHLIEPGLERFALVSAAKDPESRLVFQRQEFDFGPEQEVRDAFVDRQDSVRHIKCVAPSLEYAFHFASFQRERFEERRREIEKMREEERKREEQQKLFGTGEGRRAMAAIDFNQAAAAALKVSGSELLDTRSGYDAKEMVIQYRFREKRFECVVDKDTLQVVDAGICLEDHYTNEKGDTYFTLESLPGVIGEAIDQGVLHVYRHVD